MNNKKQLYLHIGARKTGTTALQHFFTNNRVVLVNKGVTYPQGVGKTAQHRPAQSVLAGLNMQWWFPKDLKDCKKEWDSILRQIKTKAGLVSSEFFFRCFPEHILKIRKLTADFDVKIVAYIRRQDAMVQSEYNQVVKGGASDANRWAFCDYVNRLKQKPRFNYLQIVDRWAEVFGKENIIVRPYEKQQFYEDSIFSDFLRHAFDLSLTDEYSLPERDPNSRLHRIALEYKRLINCLGLSYEQRSLIIDPLRDVSEKLNDQSRPDYAVQSPQEQYAIIQECAEDNKAIAQEYLNREDGHLFYDPLPDLSEQWEPYDVLLEDDARYINKYIAEFRPDVCNIIVQGVTSAMNSEDDHARKAAHLLSSGLVDSKSGLLVAGDGIDHVPISGRFRWRWYLYCMYLKIPDRLKGFVVALAVRICGTKRLNRIKTKMLS